MSGPKTQRKEMETLVQRVERAVKTQLVDLIPEVEALSPEAADEELIMEFDRAVETARVRVDLARRNGKAAKWEGGDRA